MQFNKLECKFQAKKKKKISSIFKVSKTLKETRYIVTVFYLLESVCCGEHNLKGGGAFYDVYIMRMIIIVSNHFPDCKL